MVKKTKQSHQVGHAVVGTLGALGLLTLTTQAASASQVTVKPGDTVWGIAQQHGLTTKAVEDANPTTIKKISSSIDLIQVGQKLTLPDGHGQTTTATQPESNPVAYTVQSGDTLSGLAQQFGISTNQLMQQNQLSSSQLQAGQQLIIGGQRGTAVKGNQVASQQSTQTAPVSQTTQSTTNVQTPATAEGNAAAYNVNEQPVVSHPVATANNGNNQVTTSQTGTNVNQAPVTANAGQEQSTFVVNNASGVNNPVTDSQIKDQATEQQVDSTVPVNSTATSSNQPSANFTTADQPSSTAQPAQPVQPTQPVVDQQVPAANTQNDLHTGSVVSLATKIANSNSVPYVWGGNTLQGMDCSGFVDYVYANAENKQLPHNSVALESYVNQHAVSEAQPGDILFWGNHGSTYHVAIYTGNNQYAAAAKSGTNVSIYTLSPYFAPSFAGTVK